MLLDVQKDAENGKIERRRTRSELVDEGGGQSIQSGRETRSRTAFTETPAQNVSTKPVSNLHSFSHCYIII